MVDLLTDSDAIFSPCGAYRYRLERTWNAKLPRATFVLLNPSTATAFRVDPTNTRCHRRVDALGYGSVRFVNLFAWRAVRPAQMILASDPVGPDNNRHILEACADCELIICGWVGGGTFQARDQAVLLLLHRLDRPLLVLGFTAGGEPRHPLYVKSNAELREWRFKGD